MSNKLQQMKHNWKCSLAHVPSTLAGVAMLGFFGWMIYLEKLTLAEAKEFIIEAIPVLVTYFFFKYKGRSKNETN